MIEFLTADTSSTASLLVTFLPMVLILVFMYIILYLPQKKQDKKDAAMRASIEVGDTVITIGGVVGRVAAINDKDDTFVLETTSDRVKILLFPPLRSWTWATLQKIPPRKMLLPRRTDWF